MTITANTFLSVNIGAAPNDGTGDPLRTSFTKLNDNFEYITNTIWPNIQITRLFTDITSSFISSFNLLEADNIEASFVGNANTAYIGNTVSVTTVSANTFSVDTFTSNLISANILVGELGSTQANPAFVTNLSVGNNATINYLTVNNSVAASSITATNIGNVSPGQAYFTNLSISSNVFLDSNTAIFNSRWIQRLVKVGDTQAANINLDLNYRSNTTQYRLTTVGNNDIIVSNIIYANVQTGFDRIIVFKNNTDILATRYINLPNNFNSANKSNITISPMGSAMMHFIPFDDTGANVYVLIANC